MRGRHRPHLSMDGVSKDSWTCSKTTPGQNLKDLMQGKDLRNRRGVALRISQASPSCTSRQPWAATEGNSTISHSNHLKEGRQEGGQRETLPATPPILLILPSWPRELVPQPTPTPTPVSFRTLPKPRKPIFTSWTFFRTKRDRYKSTASLCNILSFIIKQNQS